MNFAGKLKTHWVLVAVLALLAVQVLQVLSIVRRESLTFDEDDHMFAGYMMWHTGDYGLNPEHPPLVKLLATVPLLGRQLWVPPLQGREFKSEAYLDGRDWLARNDGASQKLVLQMRLSAGLLALGLSLVIFFATREWFGTNAALVALTVAVFDPNLLAHSALVTTDMGVTLFFLASIYAFYRYVKQPTVLRLALAGVVAGLLLATKHSGILLAPMLVLLICWEVLVAPAGTRCKVARRLSAAFAAIVAIGVVVLWAFYGFRYAARPAGLALSTSLADYTAPLSRFNAAGVLFFAHYHLLPESYLMGLVDVKRMAQFYPTFFFGKVYAHGQWLYFPAVILIKSTLGVLALAALAFFAILSRRLSRGRELVYLLLPGAVYLAVAMLAGMNIGSRHILPLYAMAAILAGAGVSALASGSKLWAGIGTALILAHVLSALSVFPADMAYANEAWGGASNLHNILSDANVDWAQQLYQVKAWQDRHPGEECWFVYFARPEIDPSVYGIRCHAMPTLDTLWLGGEEIIPAEIHGNVVISAGDLSGCEWPSGRMNPYAEFQPIRPAESIDDSVYVYHGSFQVAQAAALSRGERANELMAAGKMADALALTREANAIDPEEIVSQTAHGDAALGMGLKDEARQAWNVAIASAEKLEADAQPGYIPDLEARLRRLDVNRR